MNNRYQFREIIDQSVRFIEEVQLLREDLWKRFVNQFQEEDADAEGGWRGEYWGKMMRGACFVYQYSQNPKLYLENTYHIFWLNLALASFLSLLYFFDF